jgi:hypothetical protein
MELTESEKAEEKEIGNEDEDEEERWFEKMNISMEELEQLIVERNFLNHYLVRLKEGDLSNIKYFHNAKTGKTTCFNPHKDLHELLHSNTQTDSIANAKASTGKIDIQQALHVLSHQINIPYNNILKLFFIFQTDILQLVQFIVLSKIM